jgi:hypothetical protein
MKRIIFSLLIIISFSVNAQKTLRGKVINQDSVGVAFSTIETDSNQTLTNSQGYFVLEFQELQLALRVRHVGYKMLTKTIRTLQDTTYITLKIKPIEMDSFTVVEKKHIDFVMDFEISNGVVYSLIRRDRNKYIKAYDIKKTWLQTKIVPKDIERLKKDCFGNIHVISSDSVNQIFALKNEIITIATYSISDFNSQIKPCEVSLNNRIVASNLRQHNQQLIIDLYHNQVKTQLASIWDENASKNAAAYHSEIIRLYYQNTPQRQNIIELGVWDGDLVKLSVPFAVRNPDGRIIRSGSTVEQIGWYQNVAAKPLYCPVFGYDNNLVLFNLYNGQITHFDIAGNQIKSTDIGFQKDKDWIEQIIFDEVNKVFYTTYQVQNNYVLMEVDMETGLLSEVRSICKGCYPENIQVYGNELFYVSDFKIRQKNL